jgi:hypothetical protein
MLEESGATTEQAQEILQVLRQRLSPDEMHVWLSDPEKPYGVPDPDSEERFGVVLNWTPMNAVQRAEPSS